ncbi:hypothetical protein [Cohnella cholangitidis]|uniref:Uncharacterized protein n=1 Tax=Cohnella cholangitidis TaxID=2598458 RepID=A0A7G5C1R2_9BACL|nr:hypothetical protein [Cohnella cholangitidis]QMV43146.1 hypothetical protein FPL14_19625 [Cohnella cholangitidis]
MTRSRSNAISGGRAPFIGAQRPPGPARTPMIGAHRQPRQDPMADLQQSIGNQAVLQGMDTAPETPYYLETANQSPIPSVYYDGEQPSIGSSSSPGLNPPETPDYIDTSVPPSRAPSNGYDDSIPPPPSLNPQASNAQGANAFALKSMLPSMPKFDRQDIIGPNDRMNTKLPSQTFYAENEEQRAPYARGFNDQGLMTNASDGSELNTIGARKAAFRGSKPDRHIFTMDKDGQFHSADAIKENEDRGQSALDQGLGMQDRFHHSSFHAGDAVAGAGELQVRDGQVELLSDTSGHYQPGSKQMIQTVQQLEKNKVKPEQLGVEFVGKGGTQNMQASALELLGYADHKPDRAEEKMRKNHAKKNSVLQELLSKSANNPDGQNLIPSEINKRPEETAPESEAEQQNGTPDAFYMGDQESDYTPNQYEDIEEEQEESQASQADAAYYTDIPAEQEGPEAENQDDIYYN